MASKYLILGASSELGQAFIQTNSWEPEDEIVAHYCHNKKELEFLLAEVPCKSTLLKADFLSEHSTENFCQELKSMVYVPTHILHIPAIAIENKRFTEYNWNDVEMQLYVQNRSIFYVLQQMLPKMVKMKRGKICIILSSCTISTPPKFLSAYVMMKYALMGLTKALATEYASKNIQFNMVSPSMMETSFLANIYEPVVKQSAAQNPMKRNAQVKDVVPLLQYLFSDENAFINGANIPVTGGETF